MFCTSFNLSILECKSYLDRLISILSPLLISPYWNVNLLKQLGQARRANAFNLSILECKLSCKSTGNGRNITFNLSILECKSIPALYISPFICTFNLSILECKYVPSTHFRPGASLLISPYWNVNSFSGIGAMYKRLLLISPYWNVNHLIVSRGAPSCKAFNLSILECKLKNKSKQRLKLKHF